ncbi:MAG: hypothetical protein ACREM8_08315, partial [Vulcanimicrobiaceae bacterium]
LLPPLRPRLYSIASSPHAHPAEIHATVAVVRYHAYGRARSGIATGYLAERAQPGAHLAVSLKRNPRFRLPRDPATPLVMIGPGTGIAPFRSFLFERRARGGSGPMWLFFGERNAASDFLYREELEAMFADGTLEQLELAFSRDQAEKVYVQHRLLACGAELYRRLAEGAHLYVCGDADAMARDVEAALHAIVVEHGGRSSDEAHAEIARMRAEGRYQRDVY